MLPIWSVFPVCRCLRGDRAFAAAGSAYIELGKRCLGTDAGGCRIWLYPAIPDWLENQYGLSPGQCQRGAPPGRYRRPVLQRRSAAPASSCAWPAFFSCVREWFFRAAALPHCRPCHGWGIIIIMIHRRSDKGETGDRYKKRFVASRGV